MYEYKWPTSLAKNAVSELFLREDALTESERAIIGVLMTILERVEIQNELLTELLSAFEQPEPEEQAEAQPEEQPEAGQGYQPSQEELQKIQQQQVPQMEVPQANPVPLEQPKREESLIVTPNQVWNERFK